jgi:hypothetical protein
MNPDLASLNWTINNFLVGPDPVLDKTDNSQFHGFFQATMTSTAPYPT